MVRASGAVEVQVVGAGALNQAIKAVAIARGYVVPSGIDLVCIPTFADIEIDGENRTAIRLLVEDRAHRGTPMAEPIGVEPHRVAPRLLVDVRDDTVAAHDATTTIPVPAPPAPATTPVAAGVDPATA